jgi:hypothetical protein
MSRRDPLCLTNEYPRAMMILNPGVSWPSAGSWVLLLGVTLQKMAAANIKSFTRLFTGRLFTGAAHSVGVACERHRHFLDRKTGKKSPVGTQQNPCGHGLWAINGQEVREDVYLQDMWQKV